MDILLSFFTHFDFNLVLSHYIAFVTLTLSGFVHLFAGVDQDNLKLLHKFLKNG